MSNLVGRFYRWLGTVGDLRRDRGVEYAAFPAELQHRQLAKCKAPSCYSVTAQEELRLARNAAQHAYEFRRIHFVGGLDKTTAALNKGGTSSRTSSAWAPVSCRGNFCVMPIDARSLRRQGKSPGSIPSEIVRAGFKGARSVQFEQPLWESEEERGHG